MYLATTRLFALLALFACVGWTYGVMNPAYNAGEDSAVTYLEIEPLGQDINGDLKATTEEGRFDVDDDGVFGIPEMKALGLRRFIHWGTDLDSAVAPSRVCKAICIFDDELGYVCQTGQPASVNCTTSGGTCATVSCSAPCICPP